MKIVVDENIIYANELFGCLGEVKTIPGRYISQKELNDADALIVRSVTKVNKALLAGTPVKFVGTATSGIDHIDSLWLEKEGIRFSSAPGSNAVAVVEYIFSSLLILAERNNFSLKDRTVGIVGVGNVGKHLQKCLEVLGIRVLLCDPPRVDRGEPGNFHSLDVLIEQADILTFHTPLLNYGPYKTLHLVNDTIISRLKPGSILINTCRGQVVNNLMLLTRLKAGQNLSVIFDVWELEPNFNISLLKEIEIGTAHIAGSTLEGKLRGTIRIFEDYSKFIGKPKKITLSTLLPKPKFSHVTLCGKFDESIFKRLVHLIYDVRRDDAMLRKTAGISGEFDKLRENYFKRREWSSLCVVCDDNDTAFILCKLGFNAIYNPIN